MYTVEAVKSLTRGSANLDRMKKDIPAVVNMICECVNRSCRAGRDSQENCWDEWPRNSGRYRAGDYEWEIEIRGQKGIVHNPCRLVFECSFIEDIYCHRCRCVYSNDRPPNLFGSLKNLRLDDIQPVYESLSTLLDGVLNLFPGAEKHMKVFLRAADTF